jgi:hypothetical protein
VLKPIWGVRGSFSQKKPGDGKGHCTGTVRILHPNRKFSSDLKRGNSKRAKSLLGLKPWSLGDQPKSYVGFPPNNLDLRHRYPGRPWCVVLLKKTVCVCVCVCVCVVCVCVVCVCASYFCVRTECIMLTEVATYTTCCYFSQPNKAIYMHRHARTQLIHKHTRKQTHTLCTPTGE